MIVLSYETGTEAVMPDRLISAAAHLFQQSGYQTIDTNKVLAMAKMPRGSLYHHFPDGKPVPAAAAARWVADEIVSHLERARLSGASPEVILAGTFRQLELWLQETDDTEGLLLTTLAIGLREIDVDLRTAIAEAIDRIQPAYATCSVWLDTVPPRSSALASNVIREFAGGMIMAGASRDTRHVKVAARAIAELVEDASR